MTSLKGRDTKAMGAAHRYRYIFHKALKGRNTILCHWYPPRRKRSHFMNYPKAGVAIY